MSCAQSLGDPILEIRQFYPDQLNQRAGHVGESEHNPDVRGPMRLGEKISSPSGEPPNNAYLRIGCG
jgi:hypothetical protein